MTLPGESRSSLLYSLKVPRELTPEQGETMNLRLINTIFATIIVNMRDE
jgi:hypothetical protein